MSKTIDLKNLSDAEIQAELERRNQKKVSDREAYKSLVQETVPKAVLKLAAVSEQLSNVKRDVFQYFEDTLNLKNEAYGIKDNQQSHTFSTDNAEITIGYRVTDGWDDTVTAGIEKVKTFLNTLAKDENSAALVNTVFSLLKKDAKGNLKGNRVLELQKLTADFKDENFTDGVEIISKAYKPKRTSWFIEASTIENGVKTSVPLSMSSVDFPEGFEFDFNFNK